MNEVSEGELDAIAQPTVNFFHTDNLEIPEVNNANTNPPKKHQGNRDTPTVNIQPSPSHSPLEDTLVASADPPPRPRVEGGDTALQAHEVYLPYVCLLGADYMFYGVNQYWVHQNPEYHLDGVVA